MSEMIYPVCPICDVQCRHSLSRHVWEAHCHSHTSTADVRCPHACCWCGQVVTPSNTLSNGMSKHLYYNGGLQAHWLAYQLEIAEPIDDLPF